MITLTLQQHVGVFFGVGTVRYNPFLLRYSLRTSHTLTNQDGTQQTRFTFQRGDCFFWGNTYYVHIYLAQFWEGVFFHPSFMRCAFFLMFCWEGFSVRPAVRNRPLKKLHHLRNTSCRKLWQSPR